MKKITGFSAIVISTLAFNFSSCKKGDTGPQGPAGRDGVANISTSVQSTNNNNWTLFNNDNSYNVTLAVPAITQDVVTGGTIQVFLGNGTGNYWTGLPSTYHQNEYNFDYELGKVYIYVTNSDGSAPANPGGQQFKVVVFPPSAKSPNPDGVSREVTETIFTVQ